MQARVTLRPAATTAVALFASVLLAGPAIITPRASFAQKATTDKPDQNAPKQDSGQGKTDSGKADAGKAGNQPQAQQAGFQKWFSQEDWVSMVRAFRKMKQAKVDLETIRNFGGTQTEIQNAERRYAYFKADFETEARIYLTSQEQSVYDASGKLGQARTAADKAKKDKADDDVQRQATREVKEASDALDKAMQPLMPQLLQKLEQFVEERRKQQEEAKNTKVEQPTLPPNEVFKPTTPSNGPPPSNTKTGEGTGGSPQSTPMLTTPQDTPKKNPGDSSAPDGGPNNNAAVNDNFAIASAIEHYWTPALRSSLFSAPTMLDTTLQCTHWLGLPLQTFFTPTDNAGNPLNGAPLTFSAPAIPLPIPISLLPPDAFNSFLQQAETPTFLDQLQSAPIDKPYSTDLLLQSNVFRSMMDGAAHGGTPMFTYDPVNNVWVGGYGIPYVPGNTSSGIAIDKQGQAYVPGSGAGIDVPGTPVTNQNPVIIRRRIDGGVFLNGTPFTPQGSTIPTSDGGTPPPGQGQGGGISPNDGALTTPQNTLTPSTGNTPPANPATTDGDGKATFFFNYKPAISKGADIKTETGTAESGTQVALNTQPAQGQSVQVKFSFPHAPLPTPNTDQGALQGDWNAGGPVTATVKPDQMSSVTMPLKDNWLGLPQQGPNINLRLDLNNPNVTSYLVKTPVGQIPNFTSLVTSDTVVTGDFNGDGVGDVLMSDGSGGFNIWTPTQFFFFNPNIPGIAKPTQSLGEFLDNWQPMVKDRLWFWGGFGAQRVQIGDGMTLGNNTYTQVTGFNTDPGKPLQDTFGNNSVLINNCEGPYPGPWEIEPAHYAPGSDLPEAAVTLAKPQRRIMR